MRGRVRALEMRRHAWLKSGSILPHSKLFRGLRYFMLARQSFSSKLNLFRSRQSYF